MAGWRRSRCAAAAPALAGARYGCSGGVAPAPALRTGDGWTRGFGRRCRGTSPSPAASLVDFGAGVALRATVHRHAEVSPGSLVWTSATTHRARLTARARSSRRSRMTRRHSRRRPWRQRTVASSFAVYFLQISRAVVGGGVQAKRTLTGTQFVVQTPDRRARRGGRASRPPRSLGTATAVRCSTLWIAREDAGHAPSNSVAMHSETVEATRGRLRFAMCVDHHVSVACRPLAAERAA